MEIFKKLKTKNNEMKNFYFSKFSQKSLLQLKVKELLLK